MNHAHAPRGFRHTGKHAGSSKKHRGFLSEAIGFAKKNTVMVIAMVAAAITAIIVPPDAEYLGYFDLKTLTCLFCVLAVVCAL